MTVASRLWAIRDKVRRRAWASMYFWTTGWRELKMKKSHNRSQGVNTPRRSYRSTGRSPKLGSFHHGAGYGSGRGSQVGEVVDDDLVADACGRVKTPALRIGRTGLGENIARRVPGDEGARAFQGDPNQPGR